MPSFILITSKNYKRILNGKEYKHINVNDNVQKIVISLTINIIVKIVWRFSIWDVFRKYAHNGVIIKGKNKKKLKILFMSIDCLINQAQVRPPT